MDGLNQSELDTLIKRIHLYFSRNCSLNGYFLRFSVMYGTEIIKTVILLYYSFRTGIRDLTDCISFSYILTSRSLSPILAQAPCCSVSQLFLPAGDIKFCVTLCCVCVRASARFVCTNTQISKRILFVQFVVPSR
jgi:hypothetical protein